VGAARRDARIRFLKAQVEILRRKLGGNRVIPSPPSPGGFAAPGALSLMLRTTDNTCAAIPTMAAMP